MCVLLCTGFFTGCSQTDAQPKEVIGIIGAMDVEVNALKKAANITATTKIAEMEFCEGKLGEKNVVIVKCGMGKVNAGICAHTLKKGDGAPVFQATGNRSQATGNSSEFAFANSLSIISYLKSKPLLVLKRNL